MGFLSARHRAGMTQAEVGDEMGVSDVAVSLWESGATKPRASLLVKLAALYGVTVDELLRDDREEV